jgi:pimeloyl-ACP methyl ester carboxylesterase
LIGDLEAANFNEVRSTSFPVVLLLGRHDYTTPSEVAARWLERLRAPDKSVIWFENSAHLVQIEEPGRFLVALVERVRPIAMRRSRR